MALINIYMHYINYGIDFRSEKVPYFEYCNLTLRVIFFSEGKGLLRLHC